MNSLVTNFRSPVGRPKSLVYFFHPSKTEAQVGGVRSEVQDCTALNLLCNQNCLCILFVDIYTTSLNLFDS